MLFTRKPIFPYINKIITAFLCLVFVWYVLSPPFAFKLSLYLKCIAYKQHIVQFFFFIHSDKLPFIFLQCIIFGISRVNIITDTVEFKFTMLLVFSVFPVFILFFCSLLESSSIFLVIHMFPCINILDMQLFLILIAVEITMRTLKILVYFELILHPFTYKKITNVYFYMYALIVLLLLWSLFLQMS